MPEAAFLVQIVLNRRFLRPVGNKCQWPRSGLFTQPELLGPFKSSGAGSQLSLRAPIREHQYRTSRGRPLGSWACGTTRYAGTGSVVPATRGQYKDTLAQYRTSRSRSYRTPHRNASSIRYASTAFRMPVPHIAQQQYADTLCQYRTSPSGGYLAVGAPSTCSPPGSSTPCLSTEQCVGHTLPVQNIA
eukprot:1493835-Rhodomonas_salina.1